MSIRALEKAYAAVRALRGVSFDIRAGEVLALVGDNGAGKSTLIKCVAGIVKPDGGAVEVDHEVYEALTPDRARSLGIEVVHQHLGLVDLLDVVENLFANRELIARNPAARVIGWLDRRAMYDEAARTLAAFDLNLGPLSRRVRELSGGQRQMLAIIRAVHWTPRVIFMDEPTAALGVAQSARVLELVRTLADRSIAVVFVSHNMDHVFQVADRIVVLRHGEKVDDMSAADSTIDSVVAAITGSRELRRQVSDHGTALT
jgi:simple sugar transport system ATP-binding protein